MWIFIASDAMGFGALLLAYGVLRTRADIWPDPAARFDRALAAGMTFLLLLSGATMSAAVAAARAGKTRAARGLIALTALAGALFVAGQAAEFHALLTERHVGLAADHAAALFYVITGYHGLHVLAGVVILMVVGARVGVRPRSELAGVGQSSVGGALEAASLYWQFVDLVWIAIFSVLYLLPTVTHG
jgi:cytochrome c oxidase subunit 3